MTTATLTNAATDLVSEIRRLADQADATDRNWRRIEELRGQRKRHGDAVPDSERAWGVDPYALWGTPELRDELHRLETECGGACGRTYAADACRWQVDHRNTNPDTIIFNSRYQIGNPIIGNAMGWEYRILLTRDDAGAIATATLQSCRYGGSWEDVAVEDDCVLRFARVV